MGTIYPRSDHNPPYPEISNKDIYFDNFFGSFRNPIFGQIFGHQRAENEARNTKMKRGQETHPIKVNARYVMGGTNSFFFSKSSGNPIFDQIFGHQRAENKARNTKMYRGQETHPIKINSGYEINWAHIFFLIPETRFSAQYLATREPKMRLGTRKCIGVKILTP